MFRWFWNHGALYLTYLIVGGTVVYLFFTQVIFHDYLTRRSMRKQDSLQRADAEKKLAEAWLQSEATYNNLTDAGRRAYDEVTGDPETFWRILAERQGLTVEELKQRAAEEDDLEASGGSGLGTSLYPEKGVESNG